MNKVNRHLLPVMPNSVEPTQPEATLQALQQLIEVVAKLRSPDGGCPWDLAQTPETLIPYVIEEAYETVDAIRSGDQKAIAEELGDLLLQVVLQAQIASEQGQFSLTEVAQGISEKLIRRHPHVFGDVEVASVDEVRQNWEQIKDEEKATAAQPLLSQKLSNYARSLPPLMAATKISQKAAGAGFEWDSIEGVWDKFHEELGELQEALQGEDKAHQESELGDLLFTIVNIARWQGLDPAEALQGTNRRFIQRFVQVEAVCDRPLTDYSLEELEALWQQAKAKLGQAES
ncbi:MAG TPA: nucleoside triphosphate pyrophosphohydrolase [Allocoleopsis sp.]